MNESDAAAATDLWESLCRDGSPLPAKARTRMMWWLRDRDYLTVRYAVEAISERYDPTVPFARRPALGTLAEECKRQAGRSGPGDFNKTHDEIVAELAAANAEFEAHVHAAESRLLSENRVTEIERCEQVAAIRVQTFFSGASGKDAKNVQHPFCRFSPDAPFKGCYGGLVLSLAGLAADAGIVPVDLPPRLPSPKPKPAPVEVAVADDPDNVYDPKVDDGIPF